jgi:hypothetical protein
VRQDDFRRELGSAIDSITGSPSPALPDRVRSAVAEAPERRGPIWIAGLAAALITAIVVGVLVVANPLRNQHPVPVGPTSSPSASPATSPVPTSSASPSADANLPPFVCGTTHLDGQAPPLSALISAVRTGSHTGYDRLTFEFNNGEPATVDVTPQSGTTFTRSPRGDMVTLAGQSGILVVIHSADAYTVYTGPTDFKTSYPVMVEETQLEDFEGYVQWGIGLSKTACYRAFFLTSPTRLVIDVQAS